jgi:hypothetical protein
MGEGSTVLFRPHLASLLRGPRRVVWAPPWTAARTPSAVPGDAMRIPLRDASVYFGLWETLPTTFLRTACLVVSFFVCAPPRAFLLPFRCGLRFSGSMSFLLFPFVAAVSRPAFIVPLGPASSSGSLGLFISISLWSSAFRGHLLWAFLRRPSSSVSVYFRLRYAQHRQPRARHHPQSLLRRH